MIQLKESHFKLVIILTDTLTDSLNIRVHYYIMNVSLLYYIGSATAVCVSPHTDHLYIVGTEEGKIYKCSKSYKDHYLDVYNVSYKL